MWLPSLNRVPREPENLSQFASSRSPDVHDMPLDMTCPIASLALADTSEGMGDSGVPVRERLFARGRSTSAPGVGRRCRDPGPCAVSPAL